MEYNMSFLDIVIRYALIVVCGILFGITQWYALIALAVAIFITAVSGVSPLYSILGISTLTKEQK